MASITLHTTPIAGYKLLHGTTEAEEYVAAQFNKYCESKIKIF